MTSEVGVVGERDETAGIDVKGAVLGEFRRKELRDEFGEDVLDLSAPAAEDRLLDEDDFSWFEVAGRNNAFSSARDLDDAVGSVSGSRDDVGGGFGGSSESWKGCLSARSSRKKEGADGQRDFA